MPTTRAKKSSCPANAGHLSTDLYLSLGSNLGEREAHIHAALAALNRSYGKYTRISKIIETEPVGFDSPNAFLNLCVRYKVTRHSDDPLQDCLRILHRVKTIEEQLGRELKVEYDAAGNRIYHDRPIDIDILFFGDLRLSSTLVTVPHPRIQERDFVLRPLRQIATPTLRHSFPEYF